MNKELKKILISLLEEYQESGDVNSVVEKALKENGTTENCSKKIEDVNKLLDAFEEKAISLKNAKKEGKSRRRWVADQLESVTAGCSEEDKAKIINEIGKCEISNSDLEESLTKE